MELLVASAVGLFTAVGVYLILRQRTFPVILGLTFLSYGVNVFLFTSGRLATNRAPIIGSTEVYADPLPQALVLTAIVISFAMTAVVMMMAIGGHLEAGHDRINMTGQDDRGEDSPVPQTVAPDTGPDTRPDSGPDSGPATVAEGRA